jgi:hypothetical protein
MADPTQEAHTNRVKELLPSGEDLSAVEARPESRATLWKRRQKSYRMWQDLLESDPSKAQQAWTSSGGQLPIFEEEITGDIVRGTVGEKEFTNILNKPEFSIALERELAAAQGEAITRQETEAAIERETARADEGQLAQSLYGIATTGGRMTGGSPEQVAGLGSAVQKAIPFEDFANLFANENAVIMELENQKAMDFPFGEGFQERQALREEMLSDNLQWQWMTKEIDADTFVDMMWKRVDEMGTGESILRGVTNPVQYMIPLPIIDQLAGIALKTGMRSASDIARLSFKLTKSGVTGGRDLTVEMAQAVATWAPGRAGVAQAAPANVFGPYGEGQFRLNPGQISADDVVTIAGVSRSPYETYVSIKGKAARGLTKVRQLTTDHFAWSKNIENEIKRYWEKANPGKAFPAAYKFATELALVAGGVHHKAARRYNRWQDEIAGWMKTAEGQRMPTTYAMRLSDLMHQYDILGMHPRRAQEGVWTQDIIMRQVNELREEVTQRYQRGPRHRGEVTSWERVTRAADVISRAYKEMLNDNVRAGFYTREFADHLMTMYPNYHPTKYADDQLLEGIEIQVDPQSTIGQMGQRLAGPDEPTMHHLADTAQIYDLENPLDVLRSATLRHEKRRALNNVVKSLVKALRAWEWDTVTREGQLIKTFEFDRPVDTTGGRALGEIPIGETGRPGTPVEEAAGAVAEVPTRVGSDVAIRVPRPRAPYTTANRRATEGRAKVVYWENGKPVYVEVDANVAKDIQTLINMQPSAMRTILRTIQFPFRAIWTQYNPGFMAKNFMFEMLTNMTVHGIMPTTTFTNLLKAFKSIAVEDPLIERMYDANAIVLGRTGGRAQRDTGRPGRGGEYWFSGTRLGPTQREIKEGAEWTIRDSKDWKRFLFNDSGTFNPLKLFNLLNETAQAFELAPRMSLFQKGLERGMGEQGAASWAREGMVDFAQAGTLVHNLDAVYLYLNAGIQGAKVPFIAFSKNPKKVGMSLAMIPGLAFGQYQYNRWVTNKYKDSDTPNNWNDIPAEDRYGAISFLLPGPGKRMSDGSVRPRYIKIIPILRELALPWGGTIRMLETMDEKVPNDMQAFWEATEDQVWPISSILPQQANAGITDGGLDIPLLKRMPYPTELGETLASLLTNQDPFTGRKIVDEAHSDENVPKGERTTPWSSEMANNVAKFSGGFWEPSHVDHLFRAGGLANSLIEGADIALRAAGFGRKTPQSVDTIVAQLDSYNMIYPDEESIRMAQNSYRANLDFNLFKDQPDVKAANIMNKKAFLDAIDAELRDIDNRVKKPWTNPIDAFVGTGGYGRYSTAKRDALKQAGYDDADTRAAAEEIKDLRIEMNQSQLEFDSKVTGKEMSRLEWRQESNHLGMLMRYGLIGIFEEFPKAMQAGRGTLQYAEYMDGVNTLMGKWPDDRSRGEVLYDLWLGIQPDLYSGSDSKIVQRMGDDGAVVDMLIEDMKPLWNARDAFLSALRNSDNPGDEELLMAKITQYNTPLQLEYDHALALLRPYYDFQDRVHAGIQDSRVQIAFSKRMNGTSNQKKAVLLEADAKGFLKELMHAEVMVDAWREDWLRRSYDDAEEWDATHAAQILVDMKLAKMPDSPAQLLKLWDLASPKFKEGDEIYEQELVDRIDYDKIPVHEPWVAPEDAITDFPRR